MMALPSPYEGRAQDRRVYDKVEQMPQFPGGEAALWRYIESHMVKSEYICDGLPGYIVLGFIVERDGSQSDFKVLKKLDPVLDKAALDIARRMPKWIPAMHKGKTVRCRYSFPIRFRAESTLVNASSRLLRPIEQSLSVHHNDTINLSINPMTSQEKLPALTDFSLRLFEKLRHDKGGDIVCSPFGVAALFRMLQDGAAGNVERELGHVLGVTAEDISDLTLDAARPLNSREGQDEYRARAIDQSPVLSIANFLAVNQAHPILPAYAELSSRRYLAEVRSMPFDDDGVRQINEWTSNHTQGMIPQLLSQLDTQSALCAVNAVYFKGSWQEAFEARLTRQARFNKAAGDTLKVAMMSDKRTVDYGENEVFQIVSLPYRLRMSSESEMKRFSMLVVLPKSGHSIDEAMAALQSARLGGVRGQLEPTRVHLKLPKIDCAMNFDVLQTLKALGVDHLDDESVNNFPGISKEPLYVSKSRQKARITVNEEGTEGAAATYAEMTIGSLPVEEPQPIPFFADHPFVYLVVNDDTNTIFFIGQYTGEQGSPE